MKKKKLKKLKPDGKSSVEKQKKKKIHKENGKEQVIDEKVVF